MMENFHSPVPPPLPRRHVRSCPRSNLPLRQHSTQYVTATPPAITFLTSNVSDDRGSVNSLNRCRCCNTHRGGRFYGRVARFSRERESERVSDRTSKGNADASHLKRRTCLELECRNRDGRGWKRARARARQTLGQRRRECCVAKAEILSTPRGIS
ncbi:hypothetical protein WN55_07763 [Dufourea novaeangliae]|uniref:Uncharacterized protein n=1 Tax=Dufourea novaeangliae TaxID=178035 RepID=A0A154P6H9_DUFNO|nr:hypothetical protein WN55_07763 [Dufourea novaeangliae]